MFQVQQEHRVVRQSAFSEGVAPRKDSCLVRKDNSSFGIRPKSAPQGNKICVIIESIYHCMYNQYFL